MFRGPRNQGGTPPRTPEGVESEQAALLRRVREGVRRRHIPPTPQVFVPAANLTPRFKLPYGDLDGSLVLLDTLVFGGWGPRITNVSPLERIWAYFGGYNPDGSQSPNGTITLNGGNGTWYIQRTTSGTVSADATLAPATKIPMAQVVISGGKIVSFNDIREMAFRDVWQGTSGDILYRNGSGGVGVLSIGASPDGYVLTLSGGAPAWLASGGGGGGGSASVIPYTVLQMHMEGSNGGTVFTDVIGHTCTAVGNAQTDTSTAKFGSSSLKCDGTGDRITVSASLDFSLGDMFMVECQVKTTQTGRQFATLIESQPATGAATFELLFNNGTASDGKVAFYTNGPGPLLGVTPINDGNWHHVCVIAIPGMWMLFIDGALDGVLFAHPTTSATPIAQTVWIGMSSGGTRDFLGNIDEVRIMKGYVKTTRAFTAPTAAYSDT